jgi:hypothetical protein
MEADVKDLIKKLTDLDPFKRLGYKNIELLKRHAFFSGIDWEGIMSRKLVPPINDMVNSSAASLSFGNLDTSPQVSMAEESKHDISTRESTEVLRRTMSFKINEQTEEERLTESKIFEVEEKWSAKIVKYGTLSKRVGRLFKGFKEFEVYLLKTGHMLFYNKSSDPSEFFSEIESHRIILDASVRIENIEKTNGKKGTKPMTKFTIYVGKQATILQSQTDEEWVETIQNFNFKQ